MKIIDNRVKRNIHDLKVGEVRQMSSIADIRELAVEDIMRSIKHSAKQGYTYINYYIPGSYSNREAKIIKTHIKNRLTNLGYEVVNRPAMGRKIRVSWK